MRGETFRAAMSRTAISHPDSITFDPKSGLAVIINQNGGDAALVDLLKVIVIALSLLLGALSMYEGFGYEFGALSYAGLADYGIPIGIALFLFSALIATRWTNT
jgi:hypothetical protein